MAWTHKPRQRAGCLEPGDYDAILTNCDRAVSKKGNVMAALKFKVNYNGKDFCVRDWITQGFHRGKIQSLARSLDRGDMLEAGTFRLGQQIGHLVRIRVGIENHPVYGWCNRVEGYLDQDRGTGAALAQSDWF